MESVTNSIPTIFHFIWIRGKKGISEPPTNCLESWKRIHPEYKFIVWDNISVEKLIRQRVPILYNVFNSAENFPWVQSIIAKVAILYIIGGIYVDFDLESCAHISKFVRPTAECVVIKNPRPLWGEATIKRGFMASAPNHSLWVDVINYISKQKKSIKSCRSREASNIIRAVELMIRNHYSRVTLVSNVVIVPYGGIVPIHKKVMAVYRSKQSHHWEKWHHRIYRKYCVFCENNPTVSRIFTYFLMGLTTGIILNVIFMITKNAINNKRLKCGKLPL